MKNTLLMTLLAAAALFQAGCGTSVSSDAKLRNDLKQTGLAWLEYQDVNKKAAANWDELIAYAKKMDVGADAITRVRDAKYELKWNVKWQDAKDGISNTVLGEKPDGGPKLMMDGSVR